MLEIKVIFKDICKKNHALYSSKLYSFYVDCYLAIAKEHLISLTWNCIMLLTIEKVLETREWASSNFIVLSST